MNKDFNVYKWRRDQLTEGVSQSEQDTLFTNAWEKEIRPAKGERKVTYDHLIKNVPTRLYSKVVDIVKSKGYDIVDDEEFEDDDRGVMIWLYLKKR
jgi:hypothetical protein